MLLGNSDIIALHISCISLPTQGTLVRRVQWASIVTWFRDTNRIIVGSVYKYIISYIHYCPAS
jgi:hypothetical protein